MKKFDFFWMKRWSLIEFFIGAYKVKKFVEVGTFNADIGKRILKEKTIKLDFYLMIDKDIKKLCYDLQKDHPEVKIIKALSSIAANELDDGSMDLIFIDGDHTYEGCKSDIVLYTPKLKKGGWMLIHDVHKGGGGAFPGVERSVKELWGDDYYFIPDESPNSARGIAFKQF